jgi:hypothetical protein
VQETFLWVREEADVGGEVLGDPLIGTGLGVTHGHQLNTGGEVDEDASADRAEAPDAEERELELGLGVGGHGVELGGAAGCRSGGGNGGLISNRAVL